MYIYIYVYIYVKKVKNITYKEGWTLKLPQDKMFWKTGFAVLEKIQYLFYPLKELVEASVRESSECATEYHSIWYHVQIIASVE